MPTIHAPDVTDKFATQLIRRTARELVADGHYPQSDLDDVIQDLTLGLIERLPKFDPEKATWSTFVKNVVRRKAVSLFRHQEAECRGSDETIESLHKTIRGEDGSPEDRANTITEDAYHAAFGKQFKTDEQQAAFDSDVATVIDSLPAAQQDLCRRLMSQPLSAVARDLGVPRTSLAYEVEKLRERFRQAGLEPVRRPARPQREQGESSMPVEQPQDFLIREPAETYHAQAGTYLSSHLLADFRKCPLLYHRKRLRLVADDPRRPAYLIGRAAHTLVLEGRERFDAEYAVGGPVNPNTGLPFGPHTKAFAEWEQAHSKTVLTDEQYVVVARIADSVRAHDRAANLLREGVPEGVVRAEYCGTPCQIRMDWFDPHQGIVDLKTCDDLTYFEADARRYGYVHQLAFYRAVLAQRIGVPMPVFLIGVEKREPYRCGVWRVDAEALAIAQRENEAAIGRLRNCLERDVWPTGYEEPRVFDAA